MMWVFRHFLPMSSSVSDPVIAFEHFTENKNFYVLVISDLKMLGMNGLELLKKVKKT